MDHSVPTGRGGSVYTLIRKGDVSLWYADNRKGYLGRATFVQQEGVKLAAIRRALWFAPVARPGKVS